MSSQRRVDASRANGRLSKGQVTEEGRRRAAANRMRHGILARTLVIEEESSAAFKKLCADLHAEFNPQTPHEILQVEKMIAATWRLQRTWAFERENINIETCKQDAESTPVTRSTLALRIQGDTSRFQDLIHRYETRYERLYNPAYNLLKDRQNAKRKLPFEPNPDNEHLVGNPNDPEESK